MSKNLTAQDRSALIRLANALPSGSDERRAILAGLMLFAGTLNRRDQDRLRQMIPLKMEEDFYAGKNIASSDYVSKLLKALKLDQDDYSEFVSDLVQKEVSKFKFKMPKVDLPALPEGFKWVKTPTGDGWALKGKSGEIGWVLHSYQDGKWSVDLAKDSAPPREYERISQAFGALLGGVTELRGLKAPMPELDLGKIKLPNFLKWEKKDTVYLLNNTYVEDVEGGLDWDSGVWVASWGYDDQVIASHSNGVISARELVDFVLLRTIDPKLLKPVNGHEWNGYGLYANGRFVGGIYLDDSGWEVFLNRKVVANFPFGVGAAAKAVQALIKAAEDVGSSAPTKSVESAPISSKDVVQALSKQLRAPAGYDWEKSDETEFSLNKGGKYVGNIYLTSDGKHWGIYVHHHDDDEMHPHPPTIAGGLQAAQKLIDFASEVQPVRGVPDVAPKQTTKPTPGSHGLSPIEEKIVKSMLEDRRDRRNLGLGVRDLVRIMVNRFKLDPATDSKWLYDFLMDYEDEKYEQFFPEYILHEAEFDPSDLDTDTPDNLPDGYEFVPTDFGWDLLDPDGNEIGKVFFNSEREVAEPGWTTTFDESETYEHPWSALQDAVQHAEQHAAENAAVKTKRLRQEIEAQKARLDEESRRRRMMEEEEEEAKRREEEEAEAKRRRREEEDDERRRRRW